ncbi:hypothetical protein MMC18_001205 [Xylographa bjoerkii]|nr:hypothetical protein [Xylographa bjoerkii]
MEEDKIRFKGVQIMIGKPKKEPKSKDGDTKDILKGIKRLTEEAQEVFSSRKSTASSQLKKELAPLHNLVKYINSKAEERFKPKSDEFYKGIDLLSFLQYQLDKYENV